MGIKAKKELEKQIIDLIVVLFMRRNPDYDKEMVSIIVSKSMKNPKGRNSLRGLMREYTKYSNLKDDAVKIKDWLDILYPKDKIFK